MSEFRIIKASRRYDKNYTVREAKQMYEFKEINDNLSIQRGYVWKDIEKKSNLINSLILDMVVPPFYFNVVPNSEGKDIYDLEDGKQRLLTIIRFINDEWKLDKLEPIQVEYPNGECGEIDINGLKFSELKDEFQEAILGYNLQFSFTYGADAEEVSNTFFNLNSGQAISAAVMNRVKAKSKEQIFELGEHELFKQALSQKALDGHTNDDLVVKAHAMLYSEEEPCMNVSWFRPYMKDVLISPEQQKTLNNVFNRLIEVHDLIEDKKTAKRIYTKTHMISLVPIVKKTIEANVSVEQLANWAITFFRPSGKATRSVKYNSAAGSGSGRKEAVKIRDEEIKHSWENFLLKGTESTKQDNVA